MAILQIRLWQEAASDCMEWKINEKNQKAITLIGICFLYTEKVAVYHYYIMAPQIQFAALHVACICRGMCFKETYLACFIYLPALPPCLLLATPTQEAVGFFFPDNALAAVSKKHKCHFKAKTQGTVGFMGWKMQCPQGSLVTPLAARGQPALHVHQQRKVNK